jgi:general secretion pathway protein I
MKREMDSIGWMQNCGNRPEGGFTLMEVMIAMAILAIALVAVYQSQAQSISMSTHSRFLTTASLLAQSKMAEIEMSDPAEMSTGSGDFEDFPDYRWKVEVSDSEFDQLRKMVVTVTNGKMTSRNSYQLILYRFAEK